MSVFEVDSAGALVRRNGNFSRVEGVDEIRQANQVRLLVVRGEIPWNLALGLPWFGHRITGAGALLGKDTPTDILAAKLRKRINETRGVVEVLELTATGPDDGTVAVAYTARISTANLRQSTLLTDSFTVGG